MFNLLLIATSVVAVANTESAETNYDYTNESKDLNVIYNTEGTDADVDGEEEFPEYKDRREWNRYTLYLGLILAGVVGLIIFLIVRKKIARRATIKGYLKFHPEHRSMTDSYILSMAKVQKLGQKKKAKIVKTANASIPKEKTKIKASEVVRNRGFVDNITTLSDTTTVRKKKGKKKVPQAPKTAMRVAPKPTPVMKNKVNRKKPSSPITIDRQSVTRSIEARLKERKVGK